MSTEAPPGTIALFNPRSLAEHLPLVVVGTGHHADAAIQLMRPKGQRSTLIKAPSSGMKDQERSGISKGWAAMKRSTGIADWSYLTGLDCYVPTGTDLSAFRLRVGRGAVDKWQRLNPKPAPFGPCGLGMVREEDRWASFSTCWRPRDSADGMCPMHQKAQARSAAKRAEWQADWDASRERDRRRDENQRRAKEALPVLQAALEPLGILPDTIKLGNSGIELPAEVAEMIAHWMTEYDELRNL